MAVYVCPICGLKYDEEKGNAEFGIKPGTKFADLPEDWECPECHKATKNEFIKK